jgi:hypothetical protein
MRFKSLICLLIASFFLFGSVCGVDVLSTSSFSFHGAGVIIDLTFPEEAHPAESITHNLTITADTSLILENFTIIIQVLVNSSWQLVYSEQSGPTFMSQNDVLSKPLSFKELPQNAHGKLYCFMYVLTDKTSDPLSYTFYTTHVRTHTYSELLSEYNESLTNYSDLLSDYETLLESYTTLSAEHGTLNSTYNSLLNEYNALQSSYNSLNSTYYSLQASYDSLLSSYYSLEANFNSLNETYTTLENEINNLRQKTEASKIDIINTRNLTYLFVGTTIALIVLIIYIKKKKPEPYVVIRKETVAVKPTDNS